MDTERAERPFGTEEVDASAAGSGPGSFALAQADIRATMQRLKDQVELFCAVLSEAVSSAEFDARAGGTDPSDLGRMFVQAQQVIDDTLSRANQQAAEIVGVARATADRIVSQALAKATELARTNSGALPIEPTAPHEPT